MQSVWKEFNMKMEIISQTAAGGTQLKEEDVYFGNR